MEDLQFRPENPRRSDLPEKGPIILSEWSGIPWTAVEYRRWWRMCADEAGVPKNIRNSDSRKNDELELRKL